MAPWNPRIKTEAWIVSDLIELDLGKDGIEYVRDCLRQGVGLCRKSLRLPLRSGKALAIVPPNTGLERAKAFGAGGLLRWGDSIGWLADHLRVLARTDPEAILILQDVWGARPGDPHLRPEAFYDDKAVYYIVQPGVSAIEEVERSISSFLLIGFLVRQPLPQTYVAGRRNLDKATMRDLTAHTDEILVSAYDREGFVLWRRSSGKKKAAEPIGFAA